MQVFLETGRLVFGRFTQADVDNLFDLDSDPAVMRFLSGGKPTPRDAIQVDANVPGIVAGPHRWLGARGSGIRARQSGLGTSGSRSRNVKRRPSRCLTRQA